ncbi:MAG: rane protein of unknown function [Nitrospira sp.]|jgi:hypothetical protein|nr:rane protein of unknown function [Nitrospira sp.]
MVDVGLSFGAGLLIAGFGIMLLWGLLWLVVGTIGLARRTCGSVILLSSASSSSIAGLSIAGLLWAMDQARLSSPAFHMGLLSIPLVLMGASGFRLGDGRRIGPAFVEGSRAMWHQLLGVHQDGCGHCHEKPCEERP